MIFINPCHLIRIWGWFVSLGTLWNRSPLCWIEVNLLWSWLLYFVHNYDFLFLLLNYTSQPLLITNVKSLTRRRRCNLPHNNLEAFINSRWHVMLLISSCIWLKSSLDFLTRKHIQLHLNDKVPWHKIDIWFVLISSFQIWKERSVVYESLAHLSKY